MRRHTAARRPFSLACLLALLLASMLPSDVEAAEEAPACLEQLAAFAAEQGLAFDPAQIEFSPRWTGAGHEIKRLPGHRARLPAAACGASVAVDLSPDCRVVKSAGEGPCKATYPPAFH